MENPPSNVNDRSGILSFLSIIFLASFFVALGLILASSIAEPTGESGIDYSDENTRPVSRSDRAASGSNDGRSSDFWRGRITLEPQKLGTSIGEVTDKSELCTNPGARVFTLQAPLVRYGEMVVNNSNFVGEYRGPNKSQELIEADFEETARYIRGETDGFREEVSVFGARCDAAAWTTVYDELDYEIAGTDATRALATYEREGQGPGRLAVYILGLKDENFIQLYSASYDETAEAEPVVERMSEIYERCYQTGDIEPGQQWECYHEELTQDPVVKAEVERLANILLEEFAI